MKAWLKGGLIGLGLFLAFFLILSPFHFESCAFNRTLGEECNSISYNNFLLFPLWFLVENIFGQEIYWLTFLTSLISYFILGALIGYIPGKIKQKKSISQQNN